VYRRLKPGQAHRRYCGYTASIWIEDINIHEDLR
jgi:hypothetical protein